MPHRLATAALLALVAACADGARAPVARPSAAGAAHVGVALPLDGTKSFSQARKDGPALALSYAWAVDAAPAGSHARIDGADRANASLTPDVAGSYRVRLVVSDGVERSAAATVTVAADDACRPVPEVSATPAAPATGQLVALASTLGPGCDVPGAADVTGRAWRLVSRPPASRATLDETATVQSSFTPDVPGDYVVAAELTNALGLTTRPDDPAARVTITAGVCGTNPPVVGAIHSSPASPGVGAEITLAADVSDADADPPCGLARALSYAWTIRSLPAGSRAELTTADGAVAGLRPDVAGDYVVQLVVTDERGRASSPKSLDVAVSGCGAGVPSTTIQAPDAATVGSVVGLEAPVANPDVQGCGLPVSHTFRWTLAVPAGSEAHLDDPAREAPSFVPDRPGEYDASVVVTASTGVVGARATKSIVVDACGGVRPTVAVAAPAGAATGLPVSVQATVTDPNEACATVAPDAFAWSLSAKPAGSRASFAGADADGVSRLVDPAFVPDLAGDYVVTVVATDAAGLASAPTSATVHVAACTAPVSASIVVPAGAGTGDAVTLRAAVADPNAPADGSACTRPVLPYAYSWRVAGAPSGSRATFNDALASAPTFVPDVEGSYLFELVVTDAAGNRSPAAQASLVVASCRAPLSVVASAKAVAGTGAAVALSATVDDPDAPSAGGCTAAVAPYSYRWSIVARPTGSAAKLNDASASAPSFTADVAGDYAVEVVVTDAAGNRSRPAGATVSVSECRAAPEVFVAAPAGVVTGRPAALFATVTDANAPSGTSVCTRAVTPFAFAWSMIGRPAASRATLTSALAASPSFTPDVAGTYSFELVVTDAAGNVSRATDVDVVAADCTAPLTAGLVAPAGAATGSRVELAADVADPNDPVSNGACQAAVLPLSYAWSLVALPNGSRASLNTPEAASPSFTPDVAGSYTVALRVTDAAGNRSPAAQATVTVSDCSAPPTATLTTPSTAGTGAPVALAATIDDPNGGASCPRPTQPFAYAWSLAGPLGSSARLNAPASATPSFVPDRPGRYVVSLDAVDAAGNRAPTASSVVDVTDCGQPPTVAITAPASIATGAAAALSATVSDPNAPDSGVCVAAVTPYRYAWTLAIRPAGSSASLNDTAAAVPSLTADLAGVYEVRLVVTDAAGHQSAPARVVLTASDCTEPPAVAIDVVKDAITGLAVPLSATVTDQNASALCAAAATPYAYAWSLDARPAGSAATLNDDAADAPSFVPDVAGDYEVSLVVTDADGRPSARATQKFKVADCSAAPVASIAAVAGATTGTPVQLSAAVTDPNDPSSNPACALAVVPVSYSWSILAAPAGSAAMLNDATAAAPTLVPDEGGDYTLALVVTDGRGLASAPATTTFTATDCTSPPAVTILSVVANGAATFTASPTDRNPAACGAATFEYAWQLLSRPAGAETGFDRNDLAAARLDVETAGTYEVRVEVTDARANRTTATKALTVGACGSGPQVSAGASPAAPVVGEAASLTAAVADDTTGCGAGTLAPYRYTWTLSPPAGSQATLDGGDQPRFVPDVAGTYGYTVTVVDALGQEQTVSGSVVVKDCRFTSSILLPAGAPYLDYSPVSVRAALSFASAGCTDPTRFSWTVKSAPAGSRASFAQPDAGRTSFTPDAPNGAWTLALTATDEVTGYQSTSTATLSSDGCGSQLPFAAAGISQPFPIAVTTPQPNPAITSTAAYLTGYTLQLDASGSGDPAAACAGNLSYRWSVYARPAGSTSDPFPSDAAKPTFALDVVGDYVLELVTADGRFTSAPSFLHIRVEDPLNDRIPGLAAQPVKWNDSAVDPADGNPSIAFYQYNNFTGFYDLRFTHCNSNCSAEGVSANWSAPQTVEANLLQPGDSQLDTDQVSLLYLAPGQPAVAYRSTYGVNSCTMKYGVFFGGAWRTSPIDTVAGGCSGTEGQLELRLVGAAGVPAVAYHTHSGTLGAKYAACIANCQTGIGTAWRGQYIDATTNPGNSGHFIAMFVDPVSKLPRAAYERGQDDAVRYATCADVDPTHRCDQALGAWSHDNTIDGTTDAEYWTSIALTPSGTPGVVFDDADRNQVRLATCTSNCQSAALSTWSVQTVETMGGGDYFTRLQYDDAGNARITYRNPGSQTLRYAIQNGPASFEYFDIDHNVDDGHSSFILTPAGSTHVTYALTTGLKYYPFGD